MTNWTSIVSSSTTWTNQHAAGQETFDDPNTTYDDATTYYDGINYNQWSSVASQTTNWTSIQA